jgi:hypothetical protein
MCQPEIVLCELLSFNGYEDPCHRLLGHDVVQSGRKYNISVGSPFTLFRMEDGYGVFFETSLRIYVSLYTLS